MTKHLNVWEIFKQIKILKYMYEVLPLQDDYKKLSIRDEPNHFIAHIGTNSEVSSKSI